jgi:predicted aspartyl protease
MSMALRTLIQMSIAVCLLAGASYPVLQAPDLVPPRTAKSPTAVPPGGPGPAGSPQADEPLYAASTRHDRIGRILAPVLIDGHGPFRFVIDTGATQSAIAFRTAQTLGFTPEAGATTMLNGVTGSALVPTVEVQQLQAGDLVLGRSRMPVLGFVMADADGILGVEGLEDKRIVVDFRHDRVTIAHSRNERAPRGYYTIPVSLRFGRLLVIDARIGRVRMKAVIDTGAQATLGNGALATMLGVKVNPKKPQTDVFGATADLQHGDSVLIPHVNLGETQIDRVNVTFGDLYVFKLWEMESQPALLIGMDVLGGVDVLVIDYRRKELQIRLRR